MIQLEQIARMGYKVQERATLQSELARRRLVQADWSKALLFICERERYRIASYDLSTLYSAYEVRLFEVLPWTRYEGAEPESKLGALDITSGLAHLLRAPYNVTQHRFMFEGTTHQLAGAIARNILHQPSLVLPINEFFVNT